MKKGDVVIIKILGLDILDSNYMSCSDCALARATKRHFNTNNVMAGGRTLNVNNKQFKINQFDSTFLNKLKSTITQDQTKKVVGEVDLTFIGIF